MKAKIISIFIGLICLPLLALSQEAPEIGRIEVTTKDFEVEEIGQIGVIQTTEKKTTWNLDEIDYYVRIHRSAIESAESQIEISKEFIEWYNKLREKVLEAIRTKGVKLKIEGDSGA